jgi:moderate conductance mechanosensitive channel
MLAATDWGPTAKVVAILVSATVLTVIARRIVNKRVVKLLARFTPTSVDPSREAERAQTITAVVRSTLVGAIWILAILGIFQILNTVLSTFVLAVTLLGSALTFGAQSLIRDVLSGFFIILEDQYAVGDAVDLGVASGTVEQVTLRVTRLRDGEGKVWWVPNGNIARAGNSTQDWARAIVDVALTRDCDIDKSTATILEVAERTLAAPELAERTLEPAKVLGVQEVSDTRLVLRLSVKVAKGAQEDIRRALQASLLGAFRDGRLTSPPLHIADHPPDDHP